MNCKPDPKFYTYQKTRQHDREYFFSNKCWNNYSYRKLIKYSIGQKINGESTDFAFCLQVFGILWHMCGNTWIKGPVFRSYWDLLADVEYNIYNLKKDNLNNYLN